MTVPPHTQFQLPDPFAKWPWPRALNWHYAEVKLESDSWVHEFGALDPKSQRVFDLCKFPLVAALTYPLHDRAGLRIACNLMVLYFMFDEFTDKEDSNGARAYADIIMDAIHNPSKERPQGEVKLGEMARQFWANAIQHPYASSLWKARFIESFNDYAYSVVEEASDCAKGQVRSIEEYLELRRRTAAPYPCFVLAELGLDIPDRVLTHPAMVALRNLGIESFPLTNDVYSYNIEQAAGHGAHNLVTVVMTENDLDLDDALEWVGQYYDQILIKFQAQHSALPLWGPAIDYHVNALVDRFGYWLRGHDCWSFESERYFGADGRKMKKHKLVTLLSRVDMFQVMPMMAASQCVGTFGS
ncbi:terpenoid synthase [Gloeopeniophorella convolvens]|nr:terpenoid synthase [Gloeopeniophorella convolvens]